jgi:thymidylate synthase (FAD)
MTKQSDVKDDSNYIPVLDHGFVGLIDSMGEDSAIVQAARVSYGAGTKSVREDRGLIRYLMRHQHSSPFEHCVVKLHFKMPIFCARQFVRHRTSSWNEYSGRYSIMSDEFYIPEPDQIKPQSADNKQGRAGEIDERSRAGVQWLMRATYEHAYASYRTLLGERDDTVDWHYDPYDGDDALLTAEFPGIARELARSVLPVANYTEFYFKMDLLNLFKMLRLRADSHTQYETRAYADAIIKLTQPKFPLAFEAFEDYMRQATMLSRMETALIQDLITDEVVQQAIDAHGGLVAYAKAYDMTKREITELLAGFAPAILSNQG